MIKLKKQTSNAKAFNSGAYIDGHRHPYLNGHRAEAVKLEDGTGVLAIDYPEFKTIRFFAISAEEVKQIESIEYDPYNDIAYAIQMLNFAGRFHDEDRYFL